VVLGRRQHRHQGGQQQKQEHPGEHYFMLTRRLYVSSTAGSLL
jgi:hypothetical protein